jgi:hypothetical protein
MLLVFKSVSGPAFLLAFSKEVRDSELDCSNHVYVTLNMIHRFCCKLIIIIIKVKVSKSLPETGSEGL